MRFKALLTLLIALALGGAVLGLYWNVVRATVSGNAPAAAPEPAAVRKLDAPIVTFVDQVIGPKDAEITLVEFGDYLCSHCRSAEAVVQRLLAEQPKRLRFVWKDMPSPLHPGADTAAEAGLCAAQQGAFWKFHAALLGHSSTYDQTSLAYLASQEGLDAQAFTDCLTARAMKAHVERTTDEGRALGVDALPAFFINGARYEGALTYEELRAALR